MNPYEPPQAGGDRNNDSSRLKRLAAFALILSVVLVIGGVSAISIVRLGQATAMQEAAMKRAEQAEAEAKRALEAAKADSQRNPAVP